MALSLKAPEADQLVRELASITGESYTQTVITSLRERLDRERRRDDSDLAQRLERLQAEVAATAVLDSRRPEDIIGYDKNGLP